MLESPPQSPLISVVVPAFNRLDMLRQALESVFRQTFRGFEVIVVDDGSTEDLSPLMTDYRDRATFLQQENAGPGAARNRGARAARGEYVAFLDSDDIWFPWTLAVFARLIREHNSPALVAGQVLPFTDETELNGVVEEPLQAEFFLDYLTTGRRGYSVGAGTSGFRRTEFLRWKGFVEDPVNAEDHDLVLRMGTAPGFVKLLRPRVLGYRQHANSLTADVRKTSAGVRHLVQQERRGAYPGGPSRAAERREIICRYVRPVVVACLRSGMRSDARRLYWATFGWHLRLGRWRFLLGVPTQAVLRDARTFWSSASRKTPRSVGSGRP